MSIGRIIRKALRRQAGAPRPGSAASPKRRSERDIYFTSNFHAKAREWGLSEEHARFVFYEGDTVKQHGKPTNMKVAFYKGEEIGIYVFRDRETNQPVITSIWKRQFRTKDTSTRRR